MPHWIENPHANFVLAAYSVAAIALLGLAVASWCAYHSRTKEWKILQQGRNPKA